MKIIILASLINVGDVSNYSETIKALSAPNVDISHIEIVDANESPSTIQTAFARANSNDENKLIITVGEKGLNALRAVQTNINPAKSYVYASVHQYFTILKDITVIDNLAIPQAMLAESDVTEGIKHIPHITPTISVPVEVKSAEELQAIYDGWAEKGQYPLDGKYIIATIPGDAPDYKNNFKLFDKRSAQSFVAKLNELRSGDYRDAKIILLGSVRTGQRDPSDPKKVRYNHTYQKGSKPVIDPITKYIEDLLKTSRIRYTLYPANFEIDQGTASLVSYNWQGMALAALAGHSIYLVPCESISQMAQAALLLPPEKIATFVPSSANIQHQNVLATFSGAGCFNAHPHFTTIPTIAAATNRTPINNEIVDAITVAKSIAAGLANKGFIIRSPSELPPPIKPQVSTLRRILNALCCRARSTLYGEAPEEHDGQSR
jgi:hypothetical protein